MSEEEECNTQICECHVTLESIGEELQMTISNSSQEIGRMGDSFQSLVTIDSTLSTDETFVLTIARKCGNCTCNGDGNLECLLETCPGDCEWSLWGTWSTCGAGQEEECGPKLRQRERELITPQTIGDRCCPGKSTDTEICGYDLCVEWGTWGDWTSCGSSCGLGVHERRRQCFIDDVPTTSQECKGDAEQYEGCFAESSCENETCVGGMIQTCEDLVNSAETLCNQFTCADVRGDTTCSVEDLVCSDIQQAACTCTDDQVLSDSGKCVERADCGCRDLSGQLVPQGSVVQDGCQECECTDGTMVCSTKTDCDQSCVYTEWGEWSTCSVDCGSGVQARYRRLIVDSAECNDVVQDMQICEEPCNTCNTADGPVNPYCTTKHHLNETTTGTPSYDKQCETCVCHKNGEEVCTAREPTCEMSSIQTLMLCGIGAVWNVSAIANESPSNAFKPPSDRIDECCPGACVPTSEAGSTCKSMPTEFETMVANHPTAGVQCKSTGAVTVKICKGWCDSEDNPSIDSGILSLKGVEASSGQIPKSMCQCCSATKTEVVDVPFNCGDVLGEVKFQLTQMVDCSCEMCIGTAPIPPEATSAPVTANPPPGGVPDFGDLFG